MEATDHGTPARSAAALVNILLEGSGGPDPTHPSPIGEPELAGRSKPELPRSIQPADLAGLNLSGRTPIGKRDNLTRQHVLDNDDEEKLREEIIEAAGVGPKYLGMFRKEVYTVQVFENTETPLVILSLGRELLESASGGAQETDPVRTRQAASFRIVGSDYGIFKVEEETGDLVITQSPDREQRDTYILRIKVNYYFGATDKIKKHNFTGL